MAQIAVDLPEPKTHELDIWLLNWNHRMDLITSSVNWFPPFIVYISLKKPTCTMCNTQCDLVQNVHSNIRNNNIRFSVVDPGFHEGGNRWRPWIRQWFWYQIKGNDFYSLGQQNFVLRIKVFKRINLGILNTTVRNSFFFLNKILVACQPGRQTWL